MDPKTWLTLLVEQAPALRAAGVQEIQIGELKVVLAPTPAPEPVMPRGTTTEDFSDPDPLNDPVTFGRREGLPGFEQLEQNRRDRGGD